MPRIFMIIVVAVILTVMLLALLGEIIAGRYLNAIALFGVASVLLWFAMQMLQRPTPARPVVRQEDED